MTSIRKQFLIGITAFGIGLGSATAHGIKGDGEHRMDRAKYSEMKKQRMEKRAAELLTKLNLNAGQKAAWDAYVAKIKPAERGADQGRPARGDMANLTAPERMEKMHEFMKQREQKMAERVTATKDFYAVLTPEQRKIFDEEFRPGRGHHGHGKGKGPAAG